MTMTDLRPLMPEVGVLAFVPEKWSEPVRARHQLMPRLARYFNVVWMEPPDGWRECWFGNRPQREPAIPRPELPGFSIYDSCPELPLFYKPHFVASVTNRLRLKRARSILESRGAKKIVAYLWRPQFAPALDMLSHDMSLYHIVDEYNFSETEKASDNIETRLIRRADQIIVHSPALMEKKGGLNPHTAYLPNGVDYDFFSAPRDEPSDLAAIPHPRIGYVGVIKKELDLALMLELSERHPQWSFVFVGPIGFIGDRAELIAKLQSRKNVYFLGGKLLSELPAYNQHLDVALLSYHDSAFNKYIFPLKLHEYLAAGCPVVGTPIETLKSFSDVVSLATTADEWSQALGEAVQPGARDTQKIEIRRSRARQFDWNRIADGVAHLIAHRLGADAEKRMAHIPAVEFSL